MAKKRKLRMTKERYRRLMNEGNYLLWVRMRKKFTERALIRAGLLKVQQQSPEAKYWGVDIKKFTTEKRPIMLIDGGNGVRK